MSYKIESIKEQLCHLGHTEPAIVDGRLGEIRKAIASIDLDDREFKISQGNDVHTIIVTCHYKNIKQEWLSNLLFVAILLAACFTALYITGGAVAEEREKEHYCKMVELYADQGGDLGHPDFKDLNCQDLNK